MKKIIFILTIFLLAMHGCEKYPEAPINDIAIADKVSASTKTATISGTVQCPVSITKIELWIDTIESSAYPKVYTVEMKNKNFALSVAGLLPITTYYYRYVAYNSVDTVELEEKNFTTIDGTLASITTAEVSQIGAYGAVCGGNISNDGSYDITARGVCWSTQPNPTTENDKTEDGKGKGSFISNITNLKVNTMYYVRAYATNAKGTEYGEERTFTTNENELMVSTADISNITRTSATCGGNVARYGNLDIIARGVCWSTSPNSTIANNKTNDGTSTGFYISNITNLSGSTKYYVRAYATNSIGTVYGEEKSFITTDKPTVSTGTTTTIKTTSIVCGGNLISTGNENVTESGICWNTTSPATINNNKYNRGISLGSFTVTISGLNENTVYFVRAFATNSNGTAYGEEIKVRTLTSFLPGITTSNVTSISFNTAVCGGNVTSDGNLDVTARGVCWSTSPNPTISNNKTTNGSGTGSFTSNITGLADGTTYYVRAYATNSKGTAYGEEKSFTTIAKTIPQITTANVTSITTNTAECGGNVISGGNLDVTARGVCWSTSPNPTINDSKTTNGTGTGSFTSNITGLADGTTYYVRAYATNSKGTAYGTEKSFTTIAKTLPQITTANVTSIRANGAVGGGNVISDGNSTITARGVCWSTSPNPTINNNKTTYYGSGTGSFTSNITGLTEGTTYYVRAYATNSKGTAYGEEKSFTTIVATIPQITTANITSITANTAVCGGNVTSDGYLSVTSRGVCWSTSPNPTINDSKTTDGTGTGSFTSNITGLIDGTTYYVRAYATNSKGTAYGEEKSFTTLLSINGYDWVDLGLPSGLKWATCNVGATTPEGYGNFYAWGETTTKASYVQSNSTTYGQQISDFSGNATYDAARANWSSTWRMPTKTEMEELVNNCTWTWTTQNGVNGYRVTGPNGNSIFLPAAGYWFGSSHNGVGMYGYYLSSTPIESGTDDAYYLFFGNGYSRVGWGGRDDGHTVRPVTN